MPRVQVKGGRGRLTAEDLEQAEAEAAEEQNKGKVQTFFFFFTVVSLQADNIGAS